MPALMCVFVCSLSPQMNAVRGSTVTWRPQPWQDGDWGGGEPLSDSDSEEEDFPDDSTTPLGHYILHGEMEIWWLICCHLFLSWHCIVMLPFVLWNSYLIILDVVHLLGLKQLLDAQQLCDVTLLVEGKKFMCHRYTMVTVYNKEAEINAITFEKSSI